MSCNFREPKLKQNPAPEKKQKITLLGDDLYSRQTICELSLEQGYNFIFVAKPSSHKSMYEWLSFLEKNGEVITGEIKKYEQGKAKIYRYKYCHNVPIREQEPSLILIGYDKFFSTNGRLKSLEIHYTFYLCF